MTNLPDSIQSPRPREAGKLRLGTNESPFNTPLNRYPEASALSALKRQWGAHEHIPESCIYLCNGTEEATDLIMRVYATPTQHSMVAIAPTRTIYKRRAMANRLDYREAALTESDFALNSNRVLNAVSNTTRLILLCSPNSPTGNVLSTAEIEKILQRFEGMVAVDESYIDFAPQSTVLGLLNKYRNLILLRSFSHAWASAGIRLSAIIAHPEEIEKMNRMGLTHPVNTLTIQAAMQMATRRLDVDKWVRQTIDERTKVRLALKDLPECEYIYPSDANFLFVRFKDCMEVYKYLLKQGIVTYPTHGCLRITIGLPQHNSQLLGALRRRV